MDENQDKIVFNELKPFDKQVDDVLSGADTTSSHLEVLKKTPPLLRMVGVPNLPILMTAYHVKTITQENGSDSANYHGLNVDVVKKLPELLSDPVMIMDSLTRDDSIVVVTQTVDKENRPVIGAIKLGGKGYLNSIEVDANILSSAYGRESFQSFIERNVAQGKVLYADKEKSQELAKIPGIQFPDNFATLDFDIIIRKTNAFVNREEEKKSEITEKNEESMKADTNNTTAQLARERVQQVRDEMVKTLLEHIEKNPTAWQSGWNNIAAGAPYNGKTNTAYRGINSLYLAVIGMKRGYTDTRWVTFNQAKDLGASVKKGEKSAPVIFFEFYDRATKKAFDNRTVKDMTEEEKAAYLKENVYAVMKYTSVFNAEQCHNFPERKDVAMSEEERAKQNIKIEAIIANSAAPVRFDGGTRAYYSPGTDSIHLPKIEAFDSMQDYYATALHEIAHSTGHESRLKRDLSGGFGSESYAKEELRAELACVFMQMEQGIQLNGKHITNHAAYLNSWLEAAKKDTSVFFKAAADAQKIADYVADNYLQAADVAVTTDENATQEQTEEQSERNPMADYLRAESEKRAEEIRTVERLRAEESSLQLNYYDYTRRGALVEGITSAPRESFYGGHIAIINNNEQLEADKPAGYILASGGYSPNSGDFIDAAYGFDTYEQAREYCVEHYGIDVGESTAAQGLNQNIKEWYSRAYPNDSAGEDIRSEATFNDLQKEVHRSDANAVYGMLGEDSVIRERAFSHLAALTNTSYNEIYSAFAGETPAQKLANARAQAQRLAAETGEPYVTIEDAERGLGSFPGLKKYDIMSLSEAEEKLYVLDMVADENNGYYKTKLHIDYVFEGKPDSYESCRFDIGTEHGGLVHHIEKFLENDTFLDAKKRAEGETALEYFKQHLQVSRYLANPEELAELSEDEQRFINEYVDQARHVLNTTTPFSDYYDNMPLSPEELKARNEACDAAHAAGLPFYEGTDEEYDGSVYDGNMSVEDYKRMTELQEQGAVSESDEVPAEEQTTDSNRKYYYPINEESARRAKEANSYSDYKEGSATAEYRRNVDSAIEIATKQKALVDPMYHERIDALLDSYAKRLAANINEGNVIDARVPSILIAGGSNFNVGKKQKQNAARDRNHQEWQEIQGILDKIRSTGKGGISSDDPDSIQKLTAKLEGLEKSQETMKAVNTYYRKNKTLDGCPELTTEQIAELKADMRRFPHLEGKPYPTWALSNNNAEIRRVKDRIEELTKRQKGGFVGWEFNGGEVKANTADNRLQIFFEEKPDEGTRSQLKHNGFKWSPKANAWQRQLNENAYRASDRIDAIKPLSGEKPTDLQRAFIRQHSADVAGNSVQEEESTKEKMTLEEARNAMLDAQELLQNHYAVRIENVPHTDPEDGYESEEPAQVIYTISKHGTVREWKTIPLDSDVFSSDLPNGSIVSYEPVEFEELEEIAQKVREPIQTFKDVLRAEIEGDTAPRRSDGYYDQRVDDILEEHYRTEYGLFQRNIENPRYLSGRLYAEETFRGERVVSLTQDESGKNIAIIAQANGQYAVAENYSPEDGRRWGKAHYFDDQKSAEEYRAKNFPSENERANGYQRLATSKSPLGQEYARIKGENADSVVFYRVGDFYEVLGADAERVAEKLDLTLTGRTIGTEERVPMCGVPYHAIDQYADNLAKKGENVIVADGNDIKAHKAKIDATERRLREYADSLRKIDLEVGNTAQTDEYYLNQAREQIAAYERSDEYQQALREDFPKDFIDDSHQDMTEITQNPQNIYCTDFGGEYRYFRANDGVSVEDICKGYALNPVEGFAYSFGREITEKQYNDILSIEKGFNIDFLDDLNAFKITQDGKLVDSGYLYEDLVLKYQESQNAPVEAQERKREWLSIELPDGAVGGKYGENTMIKMPKGEFSYYAFYVPTKMLKEADGKTQLRVASDYTFRLNNDGRQVELTGQELKDSFAGKHLDKTYKRVAPSRKYAQVLDNLEKRVPTELKEIPTWCCYRTRWNEEKGKKDKFIISPIDGKWTSSKEPGKWVTFDAALKYARENNCEGLSVLLDKQYGITCIDLDKCITENGKLKERADKLVLALSETYIERSTSGNGLHIFVKDDILKDGRYNMTSVNKDKGDLEVYDDKRIMSMTGDRISKTSRLTRAGSAATVYLRQELGERRNVSSAGSTPRPTGSLTMSDGELVRWIQGSKQGSKFNDLYHGRGVSGNRSDDDAKLAHMLLYFNGGDKDQAFRIMRESGAYRPDKPDSYYRATIDKMDAKIEVYAKRPTFSADGPGKPKGKGPGNGKKGSQA